MPENKDLPIDLDGWDLHRAAKENRVDIARRITSLREIEDRDRKAPEAYPHPTTLHTAAAYNSLRMARFLLNYGVEVNATDGEGDTPLHIADVDQARHKRLKGQLEKIMNAVEVRKSSDRPTRIKPWSAGDPSVRNVQL